MNLHRSDMPSDQEKFFWDGLEGDVAHGQRQISTRSVNPGPRPQRYKRWAEIQREQRQQPFYRLLDRSFGFRLLLAAAAAFALLIAANRWEHCRLNDFESSCLQNGAGGILNVGNVESLSIATAPWSC
ncbi:hypothetical protein VB737_10080 [Synechococcus sp. BA-120 BA3]|nr:hypothetical protein [Synechococcus sp. BA-120 BA3]